MFVGIPAGHIFLRSSWQMNQLKEEISFSTEKMKRFTEYMDHQMQEGLSGRPSDLKMLPSFVTSLATGMCECTLIISRRWSGNGIIRQFGRIQSPCIEDPTLWRMSAIDWERSGSSRHRGVEAWNGCRVVRVYCRCNLWSESRERNQGGFFVFISVRAVIV